MHRSRGRSVSAAPWSRGRASDGSTCMHVIRHCNTRACMDAHDVVRLGGQAEGVPSSQGHAEADHAKERDELCGKISCQSVQIRGHE